MIQWRKVFVLCLFVLCCVGVVFFVSTTRYSFSLIENRFLILGVISLIGLFITYPLLVYEDVFSRTKTLWTITLLVIAIILFFYGHFFLVSALLCFIVLLVFMHLFARGEIVNRVRIRYVRVVWKMFAPFAFLMSLTTVFFVHHVYDDFIVTCEGLEQYTQNILHGNILSFTGENNTQQFLTGISVDIPLLIFSEHIHTLGKENQALSGTALSGGLLQSLNAYIATNIRNDQQLLQQQVCELSIEMIRERYKKPGWRASVFILLTVLLMPLYTILGRMFIVINVSISSALFASKLYTKKTEAGEKERIL